MTTKKKRLLTGIGIASAAALTLTACAGGATDGGDASQGTITIGVHNGWDEGIAVSELWKAVLEEQGYTVELEYADPAVVYTGVAAGDYDVTLDTWLPITHADYMDDYGDDMVDLGSWNDEAELTFAVNEDAPVDSIEDLVGNGDLFGGQIIGIEPASGLAGITDSEVVPGYELGDEYTHVTSSTPAMLAELSAATTAGEDVLVTLWRPHWAYDAFPIKDLEDPLGLLGDAESIHSMGSLTFEEDYPEAFEWISNFEMDSDTLYSLENAMFNEYDGNDYGPVVAEWISENQEWVDSLTS